MSAAATIEESQKYYPYGSVRQGSIGLTNKQFTGQRDEGTAFGLYDYGARFYSTTLGWFISADPIVSLNPQGLDHYAYVNDNPLRYVDPSGLSPAKPSGWLWRSRATQALYASGVGASMTASMNDGPNSELALQPIPEGIVDWAQDLASEGYTGDEIVNIMTRVSFYVGIYEWAEIKSADVRPEDMPDYLNVIREHAPQLLGLSRSAPADFPRRISRGGSIGLGQAYYGATMRPCGRTGMARLICTAIYLNTTRILLTT